MWDTAKPHTRFMTKKQFCHYYVFTSLSERLKFGKVLVHGQVTIIFVVSE